MIDVRESVIKERIAVANRHVYAFDGTFFNKVEAVKSHYCGMWSCVACPISKECRGPVGGAGNVESNVVFMGRNPGEDEDKKGLPFVGRGGQLLDNFIALVGLDRDRLYITNLVKCFTEVNRRPAQDEIVKCADLWLKKELAILKPKLLVTFGEQAAEYMTGIPYSQVRMKLHTYPQEAGFLAGVALVACTHPGAPLRNTKFMRQFRDDGYFLKAQIKNLGLV